MRRFHFLTIFLVLLDGTSNSLSLSLHPSVDGLFLRFNIFLVIIRFNLVHTPLSFKRFRFSLLTVPKLRLNALSMLVSDASIFRPHLRDNLWQFSTSSRSKDISWGCLRVWLDGMCVKS